MSNIEQTLSIIKPDAVERKLENEIKEMFKKTGFNIHKEKKIQITKSEASSLEILIFLLFMILKLFFSKKDLILSVKFLSTASGLIIERVCSKLLIIIFYKFI